VLAVENAAGRILLPGDIEAPAERALLAASGGELASRILLAPHHGSATSSTPELVAAVRPDYVLYSTGYRNRFGFPRQEVQQRWSGVGALGLATADTGAIEFRLGADGRLHGPRMARQRQRRHWTHLPPELRNSPFFPQPGIQ
jgi:competence protein ComEC